MPDSEKPILGRARPGSQNALRSLNSGRIIQSLRQDGQQTQAELARRTSLSAASISNIVRELAGSGIVATGATISSGRRATLVTLTQQATHAVGLHLGETVIRAVVTRGDFTPIVALEHPLDSVRDPAEAAAELVDRAIAEAGIGRGTVLGLGLAHVGTRVRDDETAAHDVCAAIAHATGLTVRPEPDTHASVRAESLWGTNRGSRNLVSIVVGSEIRAGLLIDGRVMLGSAGTAGAIGHDPVPGNETACRCGNRGCLETVASVPAIERRVSAIRGRRSSLVDVVELAHRGDSATLRVIDDVGSALGRSIAAIVNLLGPDAVVIGGGIAALGRPLQESVDRGLRRHSSQGAMRSAVGLSDLGEPAAARGASAAVLQDRGLLRSSET